MLYAVAKNLGRDPEMAEVLTDLRRDTLRWVVGATAVIYLSWHFLSLLVDQDLVDSWTALKDHWLLVPVVLGGLAGTWWLQRSTIVASLFFVGSSVLSTTAALVVFHSPLIVLFYSFSALAAVVLLNPLAGLAADALVVALLTWGMRSGVLHPVDTGLVVATGSYLLLTVVAAWTLKRNVAVALEWSQHSAERAQASADEARRHRAQLVQTLKQLDEANYRLRQANAALEMAWETADAAERAKSEFVTNISHELRTPLNLIIGFSELMVVSPESYGVPAPAPYRRDITAIYRNAQHLLGLTNDVLDLARIGTGRLGLRRELIALPLLIEETSAIVRDYLVAKGLWLKLEVPPDLPAVSVDRLRVRQVLLNLFTNAARFTEQGGVVVSAQVDAGMVTVRITDMGPGVPLDEQGKIFQTFHQAGAARGSKWSPGYGLGLPISKRLVELHGGCMGVESREGAGATFWFTLPLESSFQEPSSAVDRPATMAWLARQRDHIIVVVTSDEQFLQFLQRYLVSYRLVAEAERRTALQLAQELGAIAILSDSSDTGDLADDEHIPVPLLRVPFPHAAQAAAMRGVATCLTKPIRRQDLLKAIARLQRPINTILVADDDQQFVQLVRRFLSGPRPGRRLSVLAAHTGRETLEILQQQRVDAVVLDLAMPELDGEQVLARMAARESLRNIPVIIVSAQEHIGGLVPLAGSCVVAVPGGFRLDELLTLLEALLGSLPPPRPAHAVPLGESSH
ncbi:MAG: ATP-binding protein [Chloroflexi bacterium]|nr:ATP-binding protein [Chloroflexota bacterium]